MGEARRRKKLDPNWGKGLGKKKMQGVSNSQEKLDIQVIKDVPEKIKEMLPEKPPDLIGSLYLKLHQGIIRGFSRFDVYKIWMNPDLTIETTNEIFSLLWTIDGEKDEKMLKNWLKNNEQEIRNFGTEVWSKLHYQTLDLKPN